MHLAPIERQPGILLEMEMPADFRMAGWVYIMSNEHMPGIYKIGMTTTSPEIRAKELSSATGVPSPFKVEAAYHCQDPSYAEKELHDALSEYRINNSREFFKADLEELKECCDEFCDVKAGCSVEEMATVYDLISFEKLSRLNISDLLDDIELSVFGDKIAIAERLIRIGADTLLKKEGGRRVSVVFHENKMFFIEDLIARELRIEEEEKIAAGIYGPKKPFDIKNLRF
ncbi:GIY-YIG nuclease family protein [Klebsiella pneumoniae]|uniref:GIY-YIG nuclease family protein n=1 Tax=Klebsiella pneumoniae TaxID=573 RepID=UPI00203A3BA7|nr:GIY-YIG nuclease family protein [Klebsiella pneumoniae]USB65908.1 GIY-YIG nuclease family protein [Klebsiella pneumoniae]